VRFTPMKIANIPWIIPITVIAALLRAFLLCHTVDEPGDGPTRAIMAHNWATSPQWVTSGVWPPGFMYVTGLFSWIVPDPKISIRILNGILSVTSVPLLYGVVRRVYDDRIGLLSAIALAFFQLHIGLSISSLTEPWLLTFTLAAMFSLLKAVENPDREGAYLTAFLGFQIIAEMTRYEAWIFVPCFLAYYSLASRNWRKTLLLTIGCIAFPVMWLIGNHIATGNAWIGFTEANRGTDDGAIAVNLGMAFIILGKKLLNHIELLLLLAIGVGLGTRLVQCRDRFPRLAECFYLSIVGIYWLAMIRFTIVRGESLWDRYLLFGVTLLFPYIGWSVKSWLENGRRRVLILGSVMTILLLVPRPALVPFYVLKQSPTAVINVCNWLNQSPYRDSAVLLTAMNWDSTYFPLYAPSILSRHLIASAWVSDRDIQNFVTTQNPKLLITREQDDQTFKPHLNQLLAGKLTKPTLIHTEGTIQVYRLK
jgi:4-amino-4-deoxy-L-arabinose transferase-like glycosyltransferase